MSSSQVPFTGREKAFFACCLQPINRISQITKQTVSGRNARQPRFLECFRAFFFVLGLNPSNSGFDKFGQLLSAVLEYRIRCGRQYLIQGSTTASVVSRISALPTESSTHLSSNDSASSFLYWRRWSRALSRKDRVSASVGGSGNTVEKLELADIRRSVISAGLGVAEVCVPIYNNEG